MTALAGDLDDRLHALRPDLTVADAAQLLCAFASTTTYQRLVTRHGWTHQRFITWLGQTLTTQLLRDDHQPDRQAAQRLDERPEPTGPPDR